MPTTCPCVCVCGIRKRSSQGNVKQYLPYPKNREELKLEDTRDVLTRTLKILEANLQRLNASYDVPVVEGPAADDKPLVFTER